MQVARQAPNVRMADAAIRETQQQRGWLGAIVGAVQVVPSTSGGQCSVRAFKPWGSSARLVRTVITCRRRHRILSGLAASFGGKVVDAKRSVGRRKPTASFDPYADYS